MSRGDFVAWGQVCTSDVPTKQTVGKYCRYAKTTVRYMRYFGLFFDRHMQSHRFYFGMQCYNFEARLKVEKRQLYSGTEQEDPHFWYVNEPFGHGYACTVHFLLRFYGTSLRTELAYKTGIKI